MKPGSGFSPWMLREDGLFAALKTSREGLTNGEVLRRIKQYGPNKIEARKKKSLLFEFLKNFANPLILILLAVSAISFLLGEYLNSSIVFVMVILSVFLNFFQEHKASRAAEKLKEKVSLTSSVVRDGKEVEIKSDGLVPGDILVLRPGDLIVADARLIEARDFFVNQSALTGESFPVEKSGSEVVDEKADELGLANMIYAGTNVVTGQATAVVVKTGARTQFGGIATQLAVAETDNSFTLGIKNFSYFIFRVVLIFVVFIFAVNAVIKNDFLESLTFAIAVAVGLTPEFLPMIMSVTMAKGAVALSKKGVIVKKLTAIPTFGSMNILCTDKTGTITEDKIELVKYLDFHGEADEHIFELAYVNSSFHSGLKNPLDEAVKKYRKLNIKNYIKVDEIPFDFDRKRMSVIAKNQGKQMIITKGAPEAVWEVSDEYIDHGKYFKLDKKAKRKLQRQYDELSGQGYRVLAIATKEVAHIKEVHSKKDEANLDFMGFVAFLDPVKANAREAIDRLEEVGIEIKVITGDNELVAQNACKEADIEVKGVMLGHQIDSMTDQELGIKASGTTIFARFSPAQKDRVIRALKGDNNVVGYLGDGINDAPSLKSADVGISVSNAVDVAKETADFILTKKSLIELSDGVKEGRKIFGNTMKYVMMGISSNFGNMFSVLGAVLFLPFLPMLPIQILLNNFLYDISQLTIPGDNVDEDYLASPKRWDIGFTRKFMLVFGPISSVFDFATFGVMYYFFGHSPSIFQTGWFMESLATQTLVIHFIRTKKIPFIQSMPSKALLASTVAVVFLGWLIPFTPVGGYFGFSSLPVYILVILVGLVAAYLVCVELGKRIFYRKIVNLLN